MKQPPEPFYRDVGRRIHSMRISKNLKQADLGLKLEPPVTRASIANLECGRQRLLLHTASQLAAIFECPISDLVPATDAGRSSTSAADLQRELKSYKIPGTARTRIGQRFLLSSKKVSA